MYKLTQHDLVNRVMQFMGPDYEVIGTYHGSKIPIDVLHKPCGNIGQVYISQLEKHKSWCIVCKAREKYKNAFIEKLNDKYGKDYELVGEYIDSYTDVSIRHKICGNIDKAKANTVTSGDWAGCTLCRGAINSYEKFAKALYELNKNINILSDFYGVSKHIDLECTICGYKWSPVASDVLEHGNCPMCFKKQMGMAIRGVNDLWTTHPEIAAMLENQNDGYVYSYGSGKKLNFICPYCGYKFKTSPNQITSSSITCPRCSDGISYPEKFMQSMLNQLNLEYDYQYKSDWSKNYSYDFHLFFGDKEYIIEMDGYFHYVVGSDVYKNDIVKNNLADENNIHIIRINCNYTSISSRFDYIKRNIINSELCRFINFSIINFESCDIYANSSLLVSSAKLWDSGIHYIRIIADKLHLHENTVRRYLRTSEKYHMSTFCEQEYRVFMKEIGYKISGIKASKPIRCITTGKVYLRENEAIKIYGTGVSQCIHGKSNYCGTLSDGTKLCWEIIPKEEAEKIKKQALIDLYKQYKINI